MKGRVVFHIRLRAGHGDRFFEAYEAIRHQVSRDVRGHIADQVCRSIDDPLDYLLTSEWECIDDFLEWERHAHHRHLVQPMRECWEEARSKKYVVLLETGRAQQEAPGEHTSRPQGPTIAAQEHEHAGTIRMRANRNRCPP